MRTLTLPTSRSIVGIVGLVALAGLLLGAHPALAQEPCPLAPGVTPLPDPLVTASQVESGSAGLMDFARAVRDLNLEISQSATSLEQVSHFGCVVRQEGTAYRSGSTYIVTLTLDGRVLVHAKDMALSGRLLNPFVFGTILHSLGVSPADLVKLSSTDPATSGEGLAAVFGVLSQDPDAPFDATDTIPGLRPGIPGAHGYAAAYFSASFRVPLLILVGFDLNESHVVSEAIDYGDPAITAKDVVDRETLKEFVTAAGDYVVALQESGDVAASSQSRIALRDPNGPWRHGPVYLYVLDTVTNIILFHGAFPDRFELQPLVPTVRDVVTGEFVLPQVIAAAKSSPEGGFVEYYFDDPSDDTDRADIPKVGYAREYSGTTLRPDGSRVPYSLVIGSGFYPSSPVDGPPMTSGCSDRNIAASAVHTQGDVQAFVECAAAYIAEHGTEEARRAFHEDERWKHGPTYVFVDGVAESGEDALVHVYPPDPSREGDVWGTFIDTFGTDYYYELYRIMSLVDSGWIYYSIHNPASGRD